MTEVNRSERLSAFCALLSMEIVEGRGKMGVSYVMNKKNFRLCINPSCLKLCCETETLVFRLCSQ